MFGKKKHKTRSYNVIISVFLVVLFSCQQKETDLKGFSFTGETQGTTYSVIIAEDSLRVNQLEIDHLLAEFDTILSTYISASHITKLNESKEFYSFLDKRHFFKNCYEMSQSIYTVSNGLFDPSVYPLVNAWGFFKKDELVPSQTEIDSILTFTGFEKGSVQFKNDSVFFKKSDPRFRLDFNAIAQGYSADVVADFLIENGHHNFYVEIGGEVVVKGKNREGKDWKIGIDLPTEGSNESTREIGKVVSISNCGMATSGNYRNFFMKEGKKYGHTLNPITGHPFQSDVLSATVFAPSSALADAYATLFMILGTEKTIAFIADKPSIKVILYYSDDRTNLKVFSSKDLMLINL